MTLLPKVPPYGRDGQKVSPVQFDVVGIMLSLKFFFLAINNLGCRTTLDCALILALIYYFISLLPSLGKWMSSKSLFLLQARLKLGNDL